MKTADQQTEDRLMDNITKDVGLSKTSVHNIIYLLDEGNTVPFIARYRKEQSGEADEIQIRAVQEAWEYGKQLGERKQEVLRLIDEQGKLTEDLRGSIEESVKLQEVEDLYRPYRQKRRTRATMAKEKGLEPLAEYIFSQPREGDVENEAQRYLSEEYELHTSDDTLQGALDIIAEWVSDDAEVRKKVRSMSFQQGSITSGKKAKAEDEQGIYEMYYEYEEPIRKVPSHRILAMNRGEKDGVLKVSLQTLEEPIYTFLEKHVIKRFGSPAVPYLKQAYADAYKRLIAPAIERELRKELTEKAEEQAIHIFSENLKNLLLQPPVKGKVVLGMDPAYRTGCKLAVINETGKMMDIDVIYPVPPKSEVEKSKKKVKELIQKYAIEVIVVGNGTASRETEQFVADVIPELDSDVSYLIINEAGASVYSASPLAREEFPDLEVEERSAVSIARRLQDPLAELVKIDPKSVGVGQYQHDVSQAKLNDSLKFVVETAVNQVGVNVNSASSSLLQYVAGLSKTVANNVINARDEKGSFKTRKELQKIPRLGAKTFEQAAGFMRIPDGEEPLDRTAIHPESYKVAWKLLKQINAEAEEAGTAAIKEKFENIDISETAKDLDVGVLTLQDIIEDLKRPSRDPREHLPAPILKKGIMSMEDLDKGMELQGTVRNVVDFGAFIDIGVKQDGLVHISKLASRFIKHPMEEVSVGDVVNVWVDDIDKKKGRIALTMIQPDKQTE
ncbi:RNA-binding transcriptional accessory protein [Salibacterium salarium]|uniref:RNA-binding transcriptional accessory protein n=1 Tax=Salibacterium salarium TaxID=284579 RepID=A0A3R9R7X1_9BACI|nr:Tex family protein [Salibacterium salarium]RSL29154.1 RNA-binding transcriptional accessory protein [Salibacterium salarium]